MEYLEALAEQIQPQLKKSGPAPRVSHIMAAIVIDDPSWSFRR